MQSRAGIRVVSPMWLSAVCLSKFMHVTRGAADGACRCSYRRLCMTANKPLAIEQALPVKSSCIKIYPRLKVIAFECDGLMELAASVLRPFHHSRPIKANPLHLYSSPSIYTASRARAMSAPSSTIFFCQRADLLSQASWYNPIPAKISEY